MYKKIFFLTTLFIYSSSLLIGQATRTTTGAGDFNDPTKWDGAVPGVSDTAVIAHAMTQASANTIADLRINNGASLTTSNTLTVTNLCQINTGATLTNNSTININGDYQIDGTHSGSGIINLGGATASNISGSGGDVTNSNKIDIKTSSRTILAGSDIDFNSLTIKLFNSITVTNNGAVSIKRLLGSGTSETWVNASGSDLIMGQTSGSLLLDASANDNSVSYTNNGGINTDILQTTTSEYYNLSVLGNGNKRLRGNVVINNDLTIGGTVNFQAERLSIVYNIDIKGDWLNTGGQFEPSTSTVTFSGGNQDLNLGTTNENFYDLDLSGTGTVDQTGEATVANDLTFLSQYDLNGGTTHIGGDFINLGTFTHGGGTIEFNGSSAQSISGSTTFGNLTINSGNTVTIDLGGTSEIEGTLSLESGTFATNNELIIVSNSIATGRIGEVTGGSLSGNVTVQRYFDPVFQGWHQLGITTNSATLQDWNDDFLTTGFTGSDFPSFPFNNIVSYDETVLGHKNLGLTGATNITNAINIGDGHRVYLDNEPMNIESIGTVHTGNFNYSVTYTSSGESSDDGWNLISNPYASAIDWDGTGWTKTAVNDAIYIWDGDLGLYNSYIGGIGTNGGSNIIPSTQAFWVQTNDSDTPVLSVTEADKSTDNGTFKSITDLQVFNIFIDDVESSDEIAIVFRDGSSYNFDSAFDSYKFYPDNGFASIASVSEDGLELSINSIPQIDSDVSIPINVQSDAGSFVLRAGENATLPGTSCARLEDLFTGEIIPFMSGDSITFDWSGNGMISPRFLIHFSAPASLDLQNISCPGAGDAGAEVLGNSSGPWVYSWFNDNDSLIQQSIDLFGPDNLTDLQPGIYSVIIEGANSCGNDRIEFEILDALITEIDVLSTEYDHCNNSGNGSIILEINNNTDDLLWNVELVDSSSEIIYSEVVEAGSLMLSNLIGDSYTLSAINECDNISLNFDLNDPLEVISDFSVQNEIINLAYGEQLELTNSSENATSFFWDLGDGSQSTSENVEHSYSSIGYYIVTLTASNNTCSDQKTIEVQVIDQITGSEELYPFDLDILVNSNGQIELHSDQLINGEIFLELRNYLGQTVHRRIISGFNGYELIPVTKLNSSIYIISMSQNEQIIAREKVKL